MKKHKCPKCRSIRTKWSGLEGSLPHLAWGRGECLDCGCKWRNEGSTIQIEDTSENLRLTLEERCQNYAQTFPSWPSPIIGIDGRIQGIWILGNNYQSKNQYYGEYPPNYLKRVYALFPDLISLPGQILHLFSGSVQDPGLKFDINPKVSVDVVGDAHLLSEFFPHRTFNLVLADPPYSDEDAQRYGTCMVNRNKVLKEVVQVLAPKGFVCWLDQILPMFKKTELEMVGVIGIVRSTNHRFRVLTIFQKQ